ncbi:MULTISPECIES: hypothetical protein [unclassified Hydrogenophaga]|jgi:chromosome partitioning protein|uniref:nucleotide-binding protein n=1 Tax=unclassified Hydrogenophaga TaxID=2610897 RepID=UPI0013202868|nr:MULTISPECIES: hypothetical protein [unclassified Hydrogenophaga]MDP3350528.1 hypothetical protein [Hydrogenophaga sp.]QHE78541.1 hypothetical protein F9Z45_20540 [Hydrogenophaga sp. PBL-H3]QHE82966.1 hypothetical protein F9Z44_20540 [Hydrogenophaga sp. PBL-H3]
MIIIIGAEKGGVGKSQIAFNLAAYIATHQTVPEGKKKRAARVMLVDTDTQRTSSKWGALRGTDGPLPFRVMEKTSNPAPEIVAIAQDYDAIVVDVGARDYAGLAELARIADLWIAPTRVGQGDLMSSLEMATALNTAHSKHKNGHIPLCFLINAVPGAWNSTEGQDAIEVLQAALPTGKVLQNSIRDRRVWRDAHKLGRHIFEMPPAARDKAEQEFLAVIQEAFTAYPQT